jgi:CDP-glycerol glycerophosphotransferase
VGALAGLKSIGRLRSFSRNTLVRLTSEVHRRGTVPGLLSIIVPVYAVEEYLDECLATLRFQQYPKVEIVVVDDGSPDNSFAIARRHQLRDPRIRIIRRPNGGLSAARNAGVAAARGEFLAFADSDDTVHAAGYRAAVASLTETGSDFAVLPYRRIKGALILPAGPRVQAAHRETRRAITVDDFPEIQANVIMCSKVFRRDFWDRHGLSFAEGVIYEDQFASSEVYARARAFDVLTAPGYNWRIRAGSISNGQREIANLRSWFAAANESIRVLRQRDSSATVVTQRVVHLLANTLPQFTSRVTRSDQGFWELLREELPGLAGQLSRELYLSRVPAQQKVLNHLIMTDQRAAAERFIRSGGRGMRTTRVGEEDVGHVAYLTFWRDPATAVPDECFRVSEDQARATCSIRRVRVPAPTTVEIQAWAFIQNVELSERDLQVRAYARARGHEDVPLQVEQRFEQAIDEWSVTGSGYCDYRRGGVVITVDTRALGAGTWQVWLELTAGPLSRSVVAGNPWPFGSGMLRHSVAAGEGQAAVATAEHRGHFRLEVFDPGLVAERAVVQDGEVRLRLKGPVPQHITLLSPGRKPVPGRPVTGTPEGVWTATFPVPATGPGSGNSATRWEVHATNQGQKVPVRFAPAVPSEQEQGGLLTWRAGVSGAGELELWAHPRAAQILGADIHDSGITFRLRTHGLDIAGFQAVFESSGTTSYGAVGEDADGTLAVSLPFFGERWGEAGQLLPSGTYRFVLVHQATGESVVPLAGPGFLDELPQDVLTPHARVQLRLRRGKRAVSVVISGPVPVSDRGTRNQLRLQQLANQGKADERAVFFRSLYGEAANDSGLAIHHELRRRNCDLTLYWSVQDLAVPLPEGAVPVVEGTAEWHRRLGSAQYVVLNVHQPEWYLKPPGQVMVQTYHGYPYKGMGKAWWEFTDMADKRIASYLDRAAEWDYLVSPASYATPALLAAFFTPEAASRVTVIESGYPRNDILVSGEGSKVRDRIRAVLDIDEGQKAVLYAPTFRDHLSADGMTAMVGDLFDTQAAAEALGPDYVLLLRGHAFHARGNAARVRGGNIRDVTYYHDVMDLCLASDAAVLDYSSLRFDYALMRKPMIFHVPDEKAYHAMRPAIMPYGPTAPGPHVRSTEEVVAALRELDQVASRYRSAVETFISTYMELEDGHASARVADTVFGPLRPTVG